jgi:hypothetical protein
MELPHSSFDPWWIYLKDWKPEWVEPIFKRAWLAQDSAGWNPKTVDLGDNLLGIDYALWSDGYEKTKITLPIGVKVVRYVDHPFLATLPSNAPRAVRHIYTKEVRLQHVKLVDGWAYHFDIKRAEEAWEKYQNQ